MSNTDRLGYLEVSYDLLIEVLGLPSETRLLHVRSGDRYDIAELMIQHPTFREVKPGDPIPKLAFVAQRIDGHYEVDE